MQDFGAKLEYALLAALDLAEHYKPEEPISVSTIAARTETPRKYLVQILIELKRAALVGSSRGPKGGYWLMRPPDMISLADIAGAVDGDSPPEPCGGADPARTTICQLARQTAETRRQILAEMTLADFMKRVRKARSEGEAS